jgi:hypothetical protein
MNTPNNIPIVDFTILDTHNPNTIGVMDTSYYPDGFQIVNPTLQIVPPSFPVATLPYSPNDLNVFNSNNLNLSCVTDPCLLTPLPDGIWTITITVNPSNTYTKTRSFIRTAEIQKLFGIAVMKTDIIECTRDMKEQQVVMLDEIWYYIQCSIASANQCNTMLAMNLYQKANQMLCDFLDNKPNYYLNPNYYLYGS